MKDNHRKTDWHPSWAYKYQAISNDLEHRYGVSFALTNDARAGNYYFVKDGQPKGEMRFVGRGKKETFIYEFSDPFGSGRIGFEDRGGEVSGAICFPPDFKKCGGSRGKAMKRQGPSFPFQTSFSFKPGIACPPAQ